MQVWDSTLSRSPVLLGGVWHFSSGKLSPKKARGFLWFSALLRFWPVLSMAADFGRPLQHGTRKCDEPSPWAQRGAWRRRWAGRGPGNEVRTWDDHWSVNHEKKREKKQV